MTEIGIHGIINTLETRKNKRIVENNMSNKEAEKTEQLIQIYKEDPAKENLNEAYLFSCIKCVKTG